MIDSQLVDNADIVLAIFDSKLGQETEGTVSGTAHEIKRATEAGKPVHVWFSNEPYDRSVDLKEIARLQTFQKQMEAEGLFGQYSSTGDLAYKVRQAVESDLARLNLDAPSLRPDRAEHAVPNVRVVNRNGRQDYRLTVTNLSTTVTAEEFTIDFGELDGTAIVLDDGEPFDLHPQASLNWPLALDMGSPTTATVTMRWSEDGTVQEKRQKINSFGG